MAENPNTPIYSTLQKSINTIMQSVIIAFLIWVGNSINSNNEKMVSIQKDVEIIQRNQSEQYNQIQKMVSKEVFEKDLANINRQFESQNKEFETINNRLSKLEK
jgi:uncharacterized membrane protein YfhO